MEKGFPLVVAFLLSLAAFFSPSQTHEVLMVVGGYYTEGSIDYHLK